MEIGDRDRAVHITRTSLLDRGQPLTAVTRTLADAFDLTVDLVPMSDDPVATLVHTDEGVMHFQEFWVGRDGEPSVDSVEFRGSSEAEPAPGVLDALEDDVVIGPSNPVTSIGPMLAVPGIGDALWSTNVVVVSPFIEGEAFSGPAAKLMQAVGAEPGSAGLETAFPFADAFVVDDADETSFESPTVETDITIDDRSDAARVTEAVEQALSEVR